MIVNKIFFHFYKKKFIYTLLKKNLAKVLNQNLTWANQNYSVPFQNQFPNQSDKGFESCLMQID